MGIPQETIDARRLELLKSWTYFSAVDLRLVTPQRNDRIDARGALRRYVTR
jgi:hypothetical protein